MIIWRIPRIRRHRDDPLSINDDITRLRQHVWNDPLLEEWFTTVVVPADAGSPALAPGDVARRPINWYSH